MPINKDYLIKRNKKGKNKSYIYEKMCIFCSIQKYFSKFAQKSIHYGY